MEIIFLRHGKSEKAGEKIEDADRKLLPEGREEIKRVGLGFRSIIFSDYKTGILHSSLYRAWETANILASMLNVDFVKECGAINEDKLGELAYQWQQLDDYDILFVVGHEPSLSQWTLRITNVLLPFDKGTAAGLELKTIMPPVGKLNWFAQPEFLARLIKS